MRVPLLVSATLMLACHGSTMAAETAWQEVAPDVAIRLISSGVIDASGKTLMALEIDMPEATKTYWRIPGETGLPLDLDLSGSSGVNGHEMLWPYPLRDDQNGYLDFVYFGHTILPFQVDVSDPQGSLQMAATLGVCSDICIPAQARFTLTLVDATPDRPNGLRIRQAMAEVPIAWDGDGEPLGHVRQVSADTIALEVLSDELDPQSVIVATDQGNPLFGAPQKSLQAGLVLLPILGETDNSALDGEEVEVTFMTEQGAYTLKRTIESGANKAVAATH